MSFVSLSFTLIMHGGNAAKPECKQLYLPQRLIADG
jgi:hypothetical protein